MKRNEKETREQLIDPKLKLAKWDVLEEKHLIEKGKACIETKVTGMPISTANPSGTGFIDYTLWSDDRKPLALIEAKKSIVDEERGRVQACLYADALEKEYGVRPIIYYTNGYTIKIIDGIYPDRIVFGFHSKEELEYLIKKRKYTLTDTKINADICGRYYQQDSIKKMVSNIDTLHMRSLIVLATGAGKTRISCGASELFIRNNFVKRILFLADRKNLVIQAKEETYEKFLPNVPMATIIEGRREGAEDARIVFSTYQSMLSIIKDTSNCPFGIGHFDLIIIDEAHRSIFNKYAEIFDYFDALMIGLTATPRNDIDKSTYDVFNLLDDIPNYEYGLVKAVKDGYLTYFRALDRTPEILRKGIKYSDLSNQEKEEYEELFGTPSGEVPDSISAEAFNSFITNEDTIRKVLKMLMDEGLYVDNGNVLGKTIIFAKDHNHALKIQEIFRQMYPSLCNPSGKEGSDYCVIIDNQIRYNEILQQNFKNKQDIRIVISVDMMDTGVDVPEVVNLVYFKRILSKIKFWQMNGRGTRLCSNLNVISPSKEYFQRLTDDATRELHKDKQGFLIFDVCNVFKIFNESCDDSKSRTTNELSLNQKIFLEKVSLYMAMQSNYAELNSEERNFYTDLRTDLVNEIKGLNHNYIGVQKNMKYVEKYSEISEWCSFTRQKFIEIKKHIAPNVSGDIEPESVQWFDYLCYKFSATRLNKHPAFISSGKALNGIAKYLNTKLHIADVARHKPTLDYMLTNDFLSSNVFKIEEIRLNTRDLMRYFDKEKFVPIITDFKDAILSTSDAVDEKVDFTVTIADFRTYKEKVIYYIQTNLTNPLISKIQNMQKPDIADTKELRDAFMDIANGNVDEYQTLFKKDEDIIIFIRKNVEINSEKIEEFINNQRRKGLDGLQIDYVKELLNFIFQNGQFKINYLVNYESLDYSKIMNSKQIKELIEDLETIF